MVLVIASKSLRAAKRPSFAKAKVSRCFKATGPKNNRIYDSVRNEQDFSNLILLNSSSSQTLITLWIASWCGTCKIVSPIIKDYLASREHDASSELPPVTYAEIEMDSPDMTEVNSRYMIRSIPMLLAFSRGEPQMGTVVTDAKKMADRRFLKDWMNTEAYRGGQGGAGGSLLGGLFGKS